MDAELALYSRIYVSKSVVVPPQQNARTTHLFLTEHKHRLTHLTLASYIASSVCPYVKPLVAPVFSGV
jgi:hypothetical protein